MASCHAGSKNATGFVGKSSAVVLPEILSGRIFSTHFFKFDVNAPPTYSHGRQLLRTTYQNTINLVALY